VTDTTLEILRKLPFLEGSNADILTRLAGEVFERTFVPGQVIVAEGTSGRDVYLIVAGSVEVVKGAGGEEIVLAERGPGEVFGEMGLLENRPRFATVRALAPTRVLVLSEPAMRFALDDQPWLLYRTTQILSRRLRESDLQMIADLQRKNQQLEQAYRELERAQAGLVERERLERELELARQLQESILPHEFPSLPGFSCAARSQPARWVGGDFYDVVPLGADRVGLVMADVSDKGMPAALYMGLTRSLIRAEVGHHESPRDVLLGVHRLLMEMTEATMFVTVFAGVLDLAGRTLRYVRAGHDRPFHFQPGSGACRFLEGRGMALGIIDPVELEEAEVALEHGDLLVLYTDGITDAYSPAGERFGEERLREAICRAEDRSASGLHELIFGRVRAFQSGVEQFDDMALMVVGVD
jgi:serine phosphatase RsbU (regulator of sigma subunit)